MKNIVLITFLPLSLINAVTDKSSHVFQTVKYFHQERCCLGQCPYVDENIKWDLKSFCRLQTMEIV